MMMPANYSAIAENELCYVDGGWVDVMDFKLFEKNVVATIGVIGMNKLLSSTLGVIFSGNYSPIKGGDTNTVRGALASNYIVNSGSWLHNAGNTVLNIVTALGAIWYLGTYTGSSSAATFAYGKINFAQ